MKYDIRYHYTTSSIECGRCKRKLAPGEFYYGSKLKGVRGCLPRPITCLKCIEGERYLTIHAAARITGIKEASIRYHIKTNRIQGTKRNKSSHMIPMTWILKNKADK